MIRRVSFVAVMAVGVVVASASVAAAGEIPEYLERQATAVYSGEQSVVCITPDGRQTEVFEVGQNAAGVTVTRSQSGTVRVGQAARNEAWNPSDAYRAERSRATTLLGRDVEEISISDGDVVRLRLRFDTRTGVLLASDIFNADGSTYCSTRFVSFAEGDPGIAAGEAAPELTAPDDLEATGEIDRALPSSLAGFDRTRVTEGPQATVVAAFYEDGVFTFTLMNSDNPIAVPELEESGTIEFDGRSYRRAFQLGRAVYAWNSSEGGYVLVGDLPLDVQERILEQLPEPESQGFFQRLWRGLFG